MFVRCLDVKGVKTLGSTLIPCYENAFVETTGVVRSTPELRLQRYAQAHAQKGHSRSRDEKEIPS